MLILVTSAELSFMNELRTSEYQRTVDWLQNNASDYNVVWLECFSAKEPPYLNKKFPCYVSNCHNINYRNKGSNLGNSLKKFFEECEVEDKLAVQITGRYHFLDTHFFNIINENPGYDLYAKDDGHSQYFTGCFALKTEHLIQWVNETDWDYLNYAMINIEKSLWDYSRKKKLKCYEIDSIHMDCNIFGNGNLDRVLV